MDRKKLLIIGGGILVVIIIIILLILPKGNTNQGGSYIASFVLAKSEDQNKKPINQTTVFSVNDPEIHAIIAFQSLPSGTTVTYQWYDLKADKALKEDKRPTPSANFTGLSSASLVRDNQISWGIGNYEFRILLNNKLYFKEGYEVQTDAEIQKNLVLAGIKNIQLTTAVDLLGKPAKSVASIFSRDDENIYASITYENLPTKIEMKGRWLYLKENKLIGTYNKSLLGSGTFAFNINATRDSWIPIKKWPAGDYSLEIYLNGDLFKTIGFSVE